jgi:WD40 repeat protein
MANKLKKLKFKLGFGAIHKLLRTTILVLSSVFAIALPLPAHVAPTVRRSQNELMNQSKFAEADTANKTKSCFRLFSIASAASDIQAGLEPIDPSAQSGPFTLAVPTRTLPDHLVKEITDLQAEVKRNQAIGNTELAKILLINLKERARELKASGFTDIFSDPGHANIMNQTQIQKIQDEHRKHEQDEILRRELALKMEANLQPWKLETKIHNTDAQYWNYSARLSPDGKSLLLVISENHAVVLDVATGIMNFEINNTGYSFDDAIFNFDGSQILIFGRFKPNMLFLDANTGSHIRTIDFQFNLTKASVLLNPSNKKELLIQYNDDTGLKIGSFNINTGRLISNLSTPKIEYSMVLANFNGTLTAVAPELQENIDGNNGYNIFIYNQKFGTLLATIPGHHGRINSIRFSSDGKNLISASADQTARIWDLENINKTNNRLNSTFGRLHKVLGSLSGIFAEADHTGQNSANAKMVNVPSVPLNELGDELNFANFTPGDKAIFTMSTGGVGGLWDSKTGERITSFGTQRSARSFEEAPKIVAYTRDGTLMAIPYASGYIHIFNTQTGALVTSFNTNSHKVTSLTFSTDDQRLIATAFSNTSGTSSNDCTTFIWRRQTSVEGTHK